MLHPDGSMLKRKECGEMSAATSDGHVMLDKVFTKTQKVSTESDDRQKSCLDQDSCMSTKSVFRSPSSKSPIGQNKENNESHASCEENSTEIHGTLDMEVDEIPGNNSDNSMDGIIEIDDSDSDILHKSDNHGNEIGNCQGIIASKNDELVCEVGKVEEQVVVTEIVGERAEWDRGMEEKVELTGIKSMVWKPYQNEEGKVNCLPGSDGFEHSDSDMGGDDDDENLQRNPEVMDEHTSGEKEPAQSKDSEQRIHVSKNNVRCSGVESSGVASRTRAKSGSRVVAAEKKFLSIKWKTKDAKDKRQSKSPKVKDIEASEVSGDLEDEAINCGEESQSTNTYSLRKRKRFSYAEDRYGDWEIAGVGQSDPDYVSLKKWNKRRRSESFDKSGVSKSKSRGENGCVDLEKDGGKTSHETSKENSGENKTDPGYLVEEEFETVDGGGYNYVKTEAEENEYDCAVCLSTFSTEEELEDHNKIHRNIDIHKCRLCSKSFLAAHHLRRHVRECRLTFGLTACDLCGYMPVNNLDAESHAKGHRVQNPYPCPHPECKSRLPTYDSVVNHFKNKHSKLSQFFRRI